MRRVFEIDVLACPSCGSAIALAPDGTVVVAGAGGSEGDRGDVARISP